MSETDPVSCQLCLQADEWGSMVKVPIRVLGEQTPSEKVLCRGCSAAVGAAYERYLDTDKPVAAEVES